MKPTIGIVIDQFIPGGVQKAAVNEVRLLRKAGLEATLLILMRRGFEKKFATLAQNIPYKFLSDEYPKIAKTSFKLPFFTFLSTLHLASPLLAPFVIKQGEFDLLICHATTTALTGWSLSKIKKIPYFAIIHDPAVYILEKIYLKTHLRLVFALIKPLASFVEARLIRSSQKCLVDSKVHAAYIVKKYEIRPEVVYLGTKPLRKIPTKRGSQILAFSRWDKGKNPELILELARLFSKNKFIVAGTWTLRKDFLDFKEQIEKYHLKTQIKLLPFVVEKNLAKLYQRALVYIHPHFEAFGLSALEAASHGLPIIIPAGSGITEILEDGVEGVFPQKATVSAFKTALQTFITNPRLADKMGGSAYQKAKLYSWKTHTKKLEKQISNFFEENAKVDIAILETGHTGQTYLAGGDILLEKLARSFPKNFKLNIITTSFGVNHWREGSWMIKEYLLPKVKFAENPNLAEIFIIYLQRILASFLILNRLNLKLILSTTDLLPDVIPAFAKKITSRKTKWVAWVHHLYPPPHKRAGGLFTNLAATVMQLISLAAMRINADMIICRNEGIYKTLKKFRFPQKKLRLIDTGVDFYKVYKHKITRKYNFDAIFLGRMHHLKGIFDLPQIWLKVRETMPQAQLAIVGSNVANNWQLLAKEIKKAQLGKNIKIFGPSPDKKMLDILKTSKVFLLTDYEAGFSLATAEAMAAGIPVVAYDLPIFGQTYKKGFITVPAGDKILMAQQILRLLQDNNLRHNLGYQAVNQARILDRSKTVVSFLKLLNETIEKN